jgi:TolA-binding protein
MNNSFDYIDDYFAGSLTEAERKVFEQRCLSDDAFAEEVASYVSLRNGLKDQLDQQKKKEFTELYHQLSADNRKAGKVINLKVAGYAAAASLLLFIGWFLFYQQPGPKKLANLYITTNLSSLGLNMGKPDSLQAGISAYNAKQYVQAEHIFQSANERHPTDFKAVEYLGLTRLAMKKYDQALKDFDHLSAMPLYSNPGLFYKALTLMKRSEGTDLQTAKQILQQVINQNLYGNKEARNWIKQL